MPSASSIHRHSPHRSRSVGTAPTTLRIYRPSPLPTPCSAEMPYWENTFLYFQTLAGGTGFRTMLTEGRDDLPSINLQVPCLRPHTTYHPHTARLLHARLRHACPRLTTYAFLASSPIPALPLRWARVRQAATLALRRVMPTAWADMVVRGARQRLR